MKFPLYATATLALLLCACSTPDKTMITDVVELPLKSTSLPNAAWQNTPLRAQAQYILYGANSEKERKNRLGDYYFVSWYDADPSQKIRLTMYYTQSLTGSKILKMEQAISEQRNERKERKMNFFFTGKDRAQRGDILTWKMELYADGKLCDSTQSYLWR